MIEYFVSYYDQATCKYRICTDGGEKNEILKQYDNSQLFYSLKKFLYNEKKENTYFRGQAQSFLPLPSIFRPGHIHLLKNEKKYYSSVRIDHEIELGNVKTLYQQMSIMQHYGYPTRILDVSQNEFKALAFMLDGISQRLDDNNPPCIYIFELKEDIENEIYLTNENYSLDFKTEDFGKKKFHLIHPTKAQKINQRLFAQEGMFILFDVNPDIEREKGGGEEKIDQEKIIKELSAKYKIKCLKVQAYQSHQLLELEQKLNEYNYSIEALYPDMIKRAEYYKTKWKNNEI